MNRPTISAVPEAPPRARQRTPLDVPLVITSQKRFRRPQTAARLVWSEHWRGATLHLLQGLSERQHLLCLRWSTDTLIRQLDIDGQGYATTDAQAFTLDELHAAESLLRPGELAANKITDRAQGDRLVVCLDCGETFDPDSSPHPDRCWRDAERADAEAGQ